MWDDRALRVRREVAGLAAAGLGVTELHARAIALVGRYVGTELACWAAIDPETLVISTMVSGDNRIPRQYEPRLAEAEYSVGEPNTFARLAISGRTTARLSELPPSSRRLSARMRDVWQPLGLDREVRVLFTADGVCWGGAGLVRAGDDFTDRETEFLAAVAPAVGAATRLAVRAEAARSQAVAPPAIVVVSDGRVRASTPAARQWQDRLDEIAPGRFALMMNLMAVGARASATGEFRGRLRDARGGWAALTASPLLGGDDEEIAVTLEPAVGDHLVGLLLRAYGLTSRERDVCREVLGGRSTAAIADRLFISAHTVQDHLKSVFAKVGVRSRGELVARLHPRGAVTEATAVARPPFSEEPGS